MADTVENAQQIFPDKAEGKQEKTGKQTDDSNNYPPVCNDWRAEQVLPYAEQQKHEPAGCDRRTKHAKATQQERRVVDEEIGELCHATRESVSAASVVTLLMWHQDGNKVLCYRGPERRKMWMGRMNPVTCLGQPWH